MIPLGDPRKSYGAAMDSDSFRAGRRKAEMAASAFAGRNARGPMIDFSAVSTGPAPRLSGTGSALDFYTPAWRADMDRRDGLAARMDRLPQKVRRLAQERGITDIDLLTVVGAVVARSYAYSSEPCKVQLFASDVARAMGATVQRAENLLSDAERLGFIERFPASYFRSRI